MSKRKPKRDPAILHGPKCPECGYQVEGDCVIGAGCPNCGTRLGLESPSAASDRISELEELVQKQAQKIAELIGELGQDIGALPAPLPVESTPEQEGGNGES